MQTLTVSSKTDLVRHESAIESLFLSCFGDKLSLELWRWAYLDNPNGEPVATLCYDGDTLVGHYAAIPLSLTAAPEPVKAYLSMTTMVAATHRQHGLFVKLAQETYQLAHTRGIDCVIGFPNAMSTPGFRKRLEWDLPDSDFVATVTKPRLLELVAATAIVTPSQHRVNFADEANRRWRLSKPGANYQWDDGLAYKSFDGGVDLMAFESTDQLARLPDDAKVNVLVPAGATAFEAHKAFDYQFGGIGIGGKPFDPARFARQMALSDVF